ASGDFRLIGRARRLFSERHARILTGEAETYPENIAAAEFVEIGQCRKVSVILPSRIPSRMAVLNSI
ncbi:MAG TPA: hypothetical protein VL101_03010, partial [Nordella sp.]|nr:hypothetical protein [Nordella sp.]